MATGKRGLVSKAFTVRSEHSWALYFPYIVLIGVCAL